MNLDQIPESDRVSEDAALRRNPSHPGPGIREGCIGEYAARHGGARDVRDAAQRLGVDLEMLERVIEGRCAISPRLALKLEAAGWGDAQSWLWRQANYDLAQARKQIDGSGGVSESVAFTAAEA